MAAPSPVPDKSQFWSTMVEWAGYLNTWHANNPGAGLGNVYYDGQMCAWRVRDYTGSSAWDTFVQRTWQAYVPEYVVANNGGVQGFRNFTNGPLEDVLRGTSRSAQSLSAIGLMLQNGAYAAGGDMTSQELSRETALALICHIDYVRAGGTLSAAQQTRKAYLVDKALGHIDQWAVSFTAPYFRPFMGAHTAKALIEYHEFGGGGADARVVPALANLAAYTRSSCWRATAGAWGAGQSFAYTDRVVESGGTESAPDLNIFVCPYFGWLWWQTGDTKYRSWGDEAWSGGVPVYSGSAAVSGAFLGTRSASNPAGKQYNQQLFWGPRYIEWAESEPVGSGGGGGDPVTPPPTPVPPSGGGGGGGAYRSLRVSRRLVSF